MLLYEEDDGKIQKRKNLYPKNLFMISLFAYSYLLDYFIFFSIEFDDREWEWKLIFNSNKI